MDSDDRFWLGLWKVCAACVLGVAATIGSCTYGESRLVADMVKAGADPIAARCGISGSAGSAPCAIISAK